MKKTTEPAPRPAYLDPSQPLEKRLDDLIGRMTLAEKIGQLNVTVTGAGGEVLEDRLEWCRKFTAGTLYEGIGPAGGFFGLADSCTEGASQQARCLNELQQAAVENTRLKIPIICIEEGTHGVMVPGATVFPEGLAIGSTWDRELVRKIYASASLEARSVGVHGLCTLVIEPNRDPRLGRNEEGYSEDPYLCAQIAEAIVEGTQGCDISLDDRIVAVFTCFPGQSQPVAGLERGAMEISERLLREVFIPPWEAGISAGALGVMATYPAIDGLVLHGSKKYLTNILRGDLGFKGFVLGEGQALLTLQYEKIVATDKESGAKAIEAGIDVSIWHEEGFLKPMIENVQEGKVAIETVDRALRRLLRVKFLLGLFENPYVDEERAGLVSHTPEARELALRAARDGIVLLKNEENLLPLSRELGSIAVIGPGADHGRNQLGDYTTDNMIQEVVTVLAGIKKKVTAETEVTHVKGCEIIGDGVDEIELAVEAARKAGVAVVVVGESYETDGEACDVASLDLTGRQKELIRAVHGTGTPTVVVLINGRPLSIRWTAEHVPAILEAWNCGERGGEAVADVLFGDHNPTGKLPITVPRHVGQLPVYYNFKPSRSWWIENAWRGPAYVDMPATPLYEFGFGLSYTEYEYSRLEITPEKTGPRGSIHVSADVKNVGKHRGEEIVQLYVNDLLSSVSTPVKELKGFEKVPLDPGETQTVEFILTPRHLSLLDEHLVWRVEPGEFEVMVGASSEDIRLRGILEIV